MRTVFEQKNADFSTWAHLAARRLIYPRIFGTENLSFEDTSLTVSPRSQILDGEMAIDRIVRVHICNLGAPLVFTMQERFRTPGYAKWLDVTITEWNHASDLPSELYKINAGLFLYGYYDEVADTFLDAICLHTSSLLLALAHGRLVYRRQRNKKDQTFLGFSFSDLALSGIVAWRWN